MEAEGWRSVANLGSHVEDMWNGARVKDDTTAVSIRWLGRTTSNAAGQGAGPGEMAGARLTS